MATSVPLLASLPVTGYGNVTLPEGDRGELASETAIAVIDAQPTASVAPAHKMSGLRGPETPHSTFRAILSGSANLGAASTEINLEFASSLDDDPVPTPQPNGENTSQVVTVDSSLSLLRWGWDAPSLDCLPNEILMQILGFLDVSDLLTTSRINHHFRTLSQVPILHTYRLQHVRIILPPLLTSPSRPTLAELIARHIFLTHTTQISRRLARNLVAIRLSRRLP
ncbi:hypothetical protein CHU98_g9112, partial [Xylaria longipes]